MELNTLEDAEKLLHAMDDGQDLDSLDLTEKENEPAPEPTEEPKAPVDTLSIDDLSSPAPEAQPKADAPETEEVRYEIDEVGEEKAKNLTYVPNLEYSVKGETKKFDDRLHGIIATPEDESFVRDLVTKAEGMDSYKAKLTETETKMGEQEEMIAQLGQRKTNLEDFYVNLISERDNNNIRGVMASLGLSEDAILNHAIEVAKERNLPADERARVQQQRQMAEQIQTTSAQATYQQQVMQNQLLDQQSKLAQMQEEAERKELRFALDNSHKQLEEAMKTNNLNLEEEVIITGRHLASTRLEGQAPVTVEEAVKATVAKYAPYVNTQPAKPVAPPAPKQQRQAIPTVNGGSTVPVSSQPRNMDDLKKIYERLEQESTRQAF